MDLKKLYAILNETTAQLRKGEVFEGSPELVAQAKEGVSLDKMQGGGVLEINAMPHVSEAPDHLEAVDLEFLVIGVDRVKAEARRADLIAVLRTYPKPERLADGPSYIEVGAEIGDQGAAFQLFALGKVLGLWSIITPALMGIAGSEARQLAGQGFVMITGWQNDRQAAQAA